MVTLSKEEFQLFQQLVESEYGIHLPYQRESRLAEAISECMRESKSSSVRHYYESLLGPEGHKNLANLVEKLTIGETYFLRNPAQLEVIKTHVFPELLKTVNVLGRELRIWSAGCSTGEEPYSLAMLLLEISRDVIRQPLSIVGTDANQESLDAAERATYGRWSLRQTPPHMLQKYFVKQADEHFTPVPKVRQAVRFQYHNLLKESFSLDGLGPPDIIVCRNVMIYFKTDVNRRLIEKFADCLSEGGYLVLGEVETVWPMPRNLVPMEFPGVIIFRKHSAGIAAPERSFVPIPVPRALGRPSITPADDHVSFPSYLAEASALADRGEYAGAEEYLKKTVALDNLCAVAYYLLGVLAQRQGQWKEAIQYLRKALYVDPSLALAYFSMGRIYQQQNQPAKAKHAFLNAMALLETMEEEATVPWTEEMTCATLNGACRQSLNSLESKV